MRDKTLIIAWALQGLMLSASAATGVADEIKEIPWRNSPELEVEHLGRPAGAPVFAELPLMSVPGEQERWVKPFWLREPDRQLRFITLDLPSGRVRRHPLTLIAHMRVRCGGQGQVSIGARGCWITDNPLHSTARESNAAFSYITLKPCRIRRPSPRES